MHNLIRNRQFSYRPLVLVLLISFLLLKESYCQNHHERYNSINVLHYRFNIELNDSSNTVRCIAKVKILFKKELESFMLDLSKMKENGKGMQIEYISREGIEIKYSHKNEQVVIFDTSIKIGQERTYFISYYGVPENGLIITENLFGDRVFFADHWPNRAHYWLPTVDHPSDKAMVEFVVKAPAHYQVVSNGQQIEETNSGENTVTHWKSDIPLPTKVMVIGVAQFATQFYSGPYNIPMSTWVYPQNRKEGFLDYQVAIKPVDFFSSYIAPYPYYQLANVQAKTMFGGMENAGCIFYSEKTVTGNQDHELLFAHEIAHQWFGNSVTEQNWHHIWLSEGFATYLTGVYIQELYGKAAFQNWLAYKRNKLLANAKDNYFPIVDTTMSISLDLLNDNTYDKAAFFLHMLRKELGDKIFSESVQTFYQRFKYRNALTEDFLIVVEELSGKEFDDFFNQWLYKPGHPKLKCYSDYQEGNVTLIIKQKQKKIFKIPLEVKLIFDDGSSLIENLNVKSRQETFKIESSKAPSEIIYNPDNWLLFEFIEE